MAFYLGRVERIADPRIDALALGWQIAANSVTSFILQVPPYNFSAGATSLINIPAIIGNLIGAFVGGKLTDIWVRRWAKTHGGIFSAESRLVLLVAPAIAVPAGLIMFGIGAEDSLHWIVLFVGYALIGMVNSAVSIAMTYTVDTHFKIQAEALLLINGLKNTIG